MRQITAQELGIPSALPMPQRADWRIGIIGLGGISQAHVPAYQQAGWNIVAVADPLEAAQQRARETLPEAQIYSDYNDLLNNENVEVVALLTQPNLRLPVVEATVKAGRPMLIEKPLANTLEEAQQIADIADECSISIAVSQNYRWIESPFVVHHLIKAGYVGNVHLASIEIYGTQDRDLASHDFYSTCDNFLTVQWNTHLADLLQYWTDETPQRRWTSTRRAAYQNFKSDSLLISVVDFGEGVTGHILHSELLRSGATGTPCRVDGDAGSILFQLWGKEVEIYSDKLSDGPAKLDISALQLQHSMAGSMGDLLISLEQGCEPSVSARRNLATLNAALSDQQSSLQGGVWL